MDTTPEHGADSGTAAGRSWFACCTRSRHEKQVERLLDEQGVNSFLPVLSHVRQWRDRRKVVMLPLFPGYIFVHAALAELARLLAIPGMAGIVRINGEPAPVREEELVNVRRFAAALESERIKPNLVAYVETGEWVEVMSGPFQGVRGVVIDQRTRRRVLVGLRSTGYALEVDIAASALQLTSPPRPDSS